MESEGKRKGEWELFYVFKSTAVAFTYDEKKTIDFCDAHILTQNRIGERRERDNLEERRGEGREWGVGGREREEKERMGSCCILDPPPAVAFTYDAKKRLISAIHTS